MYSPIHVFILPLRYRERIRPGRYSSPLRQEKILKFILTCIMVYSNHICCPNQLKHVVIAGLGKLHYSWGLFPTLASVLVAEEHI